MRFRIDGIQSNLEEGSQNLLKQIGREFSDISRWDFSFRNSIARELYGKHITLVWKPSSTVYNYLKTKNEESRNNKVKTINVKMSHNRAVTISTSNKDRRNKRFGHLRSIHNNFDDESKSIICEFVIPPVLLSYSRVSLSDPDILTSQRITLTITVPFMSNTPGFPSIMRATDQYKEEYNGTIPHGGGPIKWTYSIKCKISSYNNIYNIESQDWKCHDHRVIQNNARR